MPAAPAPTTATSTSDASPLIPSPYFRQDESLRRPPLPRDDPAVYQGALPRGSAPEYTSSATAPPTGCMDDLAQTLLAFIKEHERWAIAVMFVTGFIESSAVV